MKLSFCMFPGLFLERLIVFLQREIIRVPCILLKLDDLVSCNLYEMFFAKLLLCCGCMVSWGQINKYIQ